MLTKPPPISWWESNSASLHQTQGASAVVMLTAAEELKSGTPRARPNVVHELGFAQGRLGVRNTIVLAEDSVEVPSNLAGYQEIRFKLGEAHTTRKDLLAAVANRKREQVDSMVSRPNS